MNDYKKKREKVQERVDVLSKESTRIKLRRGKLMKIIAAKDKEFDEALEDLLTIIKLSKA